MDNAFHAELWKLAEWLDGDASDHLRALLDRHQIERPDYLTTVILDGQLRLDADKVIWERPVDRVPDDDGLSMRHVASIHSYASVYTSVYTSVYVAGTPVPICRRNARVTSRGTLTARIVEIDGGDDI